MARQGTPCLLDPANTVGQLHPAFMPGRAVATSGRYT
jgi:hypothetical protein